MAPHRTMASVGLLIHALRLADAQTSSSSTCEFLTVNGGVSPGSYYRTTLQSDDGRSVYAQTGSGGETVAVLLFAKSGVVGRRLLENEEERWSREAPTTTATAAARSDGGDRRGQSSPSGGENSAGKSFRRQHPQLQDDGGGGGGGGDDGGDYRGVGEAAPRRARSLAGCAGGFWINKSGGGGLLDGSTSSGSSSSSAAGAASSPSLDVAIYPVYAVPDCADHPADISTDWFTVGCSTCELEDASPPVVVECDDESGGATAIPAPTAIYGTPAPTITRETLVPSSVYTTTGPVDTSPPTPTATAPASSWTASPSPVESGLLVPEGPETIAPSFGGSGGSATPSLGGGDDDENDGSNTPPPGGGDVGAGDAEGGEGSVAASKAGRPAPPARGTAALVVVAAAVAAADAVSVFSMPFVPLLL